MDEMNLSIPMITDDESPCGYFPERKTCSLLTLSPWLYECFGENFPLRQYFGIMLEYGARRYSQAFYFQKCKECNECIPIRIPVEEFLPSKSQKKIWNKNQDLEVTLKTPDETISDLYAVLYREYDNYHNEKNPEYQKMTIPEAKEQLSKMISGYDAVWIMEYRFNNHLLGVGILDYSENQDEKKYALSSNYFFYDVSPEVKKRSLGVFSVLKEIELCREQNIPYYYLGLYLPNCSKMNYKTNYKPYELYLNNKWIKYQKLPSPGELYPEYPEIAFATEEITLDLLYSAYQQGIFPWFNEEDGSPVLWQSPDPRFVLPVEDLHISKSLKKFLKNNPYTYTMDKCFDRIIKECSSMPREGQNGTWIGKKMIKAYNEFYKAGFAHSIEVWDGEKLAGGFYGILMGTVFFGESMFTLSENSSKSAFVLFAQSFKECGGKLIDCQVYTDNMARYGAKEISRKDFLKLEKEYLPEALSGNLKKVFLERANTKPQK